MKRHVWYWGLIAPLPLFLAIVYLVPFLGVVRWSVTEPQLGFGNYVRVFTDPLVLSVLWRTLRVCVLVTLATTIMAYALSYIWVFASPPIQRLVEFGVLIPFWISTLTRAFGWLVLLYNRGLINTGLRDLGLIDFPLTLVRNEFGVVVGMTHFLVPFAVLPLVSSMRHLDTRVLTAARGMGASRFHVFRSVLFPMTMPGVVGAALITLIFSLGFFITPAILGGGRSVLVAEFIYVQIFQTVDWGIAGAISVVLMVAVAALIALFIRLTRVEQMVG
ncbi:ABC transporter permease [Pararhizobium mangrovi]|uniref:ABC transporter permease n=1 Tax=Pararhizobium mangrovi TaxID=2590452 RepID=A0A506UFS6_9HYPH|nr:ABC transporter permease [Pararhizobium mangrovi]TPW31974.1 ABC transporter permease [Pararhizobium mangrovi]